MGSLCYLIDLIAQLPGKEMDIDTYIRIYKWDICILYK